MKGVFGGRYIGWWWSVVRERCDRWGLAGKIAVGGMVHLFRFPKRSKLKKLFTIFE